MKNSSHIYIPPRMYELLKSIYTRKVTVVSAPDGSGRSTILREFVRRSRPEGISCRFITGCTDANECFAKVCRIVLGHEEHIPLSADDHIRLCRLFSETLPDKPAVIVLDCDAAQDMLLRNLYCARLFTESSHISLVITCPKLARQYDRLIQALNINLITSRQLALTIDETRNYLALFGLSDDDVYNAYHIHEMISGNISKTRLCMMILSRGESIRSYAINELIGSALLDRLDKKAWLSVICLCAFEHIDEQTCRSIMEEESIVRHFQIKSFSASDIEECTELANNLIPLITHNKKQGTYSPHILLKRATYKRFLSLPEDVRRAFHICSAKDYMRSKKTFRAFCQYFLAGDYEKCAAIPFEERISFELLMRSKDLILKFVQECPLEQKNIIPRLLRLLALLMLTPHRDLVKYRFDEIIQHIQRSPDYTERERRNILSYAYALRTYEDFYMLEKMGMNIKRAYDLYSGGTLSNPPFYSWSLYTPSVFCLIHRFDIPLSTESEQFVRYHRMYSEMIKHGKHGDSLYAAELHYYLGDFDNALSCALEIADSCTEYYLPSKLIALCLAARCALMNGSYDIYKRSTDAICGIIRKNTSNEVGELAMLCLSSICCLKGGSEEDIWPVITTPDSEVLLNRYSAPFYFFVRSFAMMSHGDYGILLSKKEYYLNSALNIRNETVYLMLKLTISAAYFRTGDTANAALYIKEVLDSLRNSGTIIPATELCIHQPQLFAFAEQALPEEYHTLITTITETAKQPRRCIEAIRTQELTETGAANRQQQAMMMTLNSAMDALEDLRKKYGLTRKALKYAIFASRGISNKEIAAINETTADSVKSSLKRTFAKLGIRSRGQLKHIFIFRE
ncbi:MAG: hypothetical protein IJZ95_08280 [Oscillospiraceae bacterium]|nr:hypothetical protein [Oscillospiraceae bacterium]